MNHPHCSRRRWLIGSALASGSWLAGPATAKPIGSNDRFRVGVIGMGARGKYLIGNLPDSVRVAAICDCAKSQLTRTFRPEPKFNEVLAPFLRSDADHTAQYQDYRRMIDDRSLDAVIISTPDHHHALATIHSLQAGMDVYLEKPLAGTIEEGRRLVREVQRTGRVLQVGSQQRSMEVNRFACQWIREGGLGKVFKVELPCYPGPIDSAQWESESRPASMNWDLFLGPAPMRDYSKYWWIKDDFRVGELLWRGWDLFRDFSGHLMTNWGAHSVDMVQYALGKDDSGPVEIRSSPIDDVEANWKAWSLKTPPVGSRYSHSVAAAKDSWNQSGTTRRFWPVQMRYADGIELNFLPGPNLICFYGQRGVLKMRRNFFETDPPDLVTDRPGEEAIANWVGVGNVAKPHIENWLQAIRGHETLNAPINVGHRSITICHLANIARQFDRPLKWDPDVESFVGDEAANQWLTRPRRKGFELPA